MKTFGFALALAASCAAAPLCAGTFPVQGDHPGQALLQLVAADNNYAATPGHRRGGGRRGHGAASKSVDPAVPSMKGVSQESADKAYKSKYGF